MEFVQASSNGKSIIAYYLPASAAIIGPAEIIDLIWISVLGVVSLSRN
jgi:hypothetical protein